MLDHESKQVILRIATHAAQNRKFLDDLLDPDKRSGRLFDRETQQLKFGLYPELYEALIGFPRLDSLNDFIGKATELDVRYGGSGERKY